MFGIVLILACVGFAALGKSLHNGVRSEAGSYFLYLLCNLAAVACMLSGAFLLATHMH